MVGLDPGHIEGITGFRKSAEVYELSRRHATAHNFSTAIVGAASQALSFACAACRLLELQPVYDPAQTDLTDKPIWHDNGCMHFPEGPGLGLEIQEGVVRSMALCG